MLILAFVRLSLGYGFNVNFDAISKIFLDFPSLGSSVISDVNYFSEVFSNISISFNNIKDISSFFSALGSLTGFFQAIFALIVDVVKIPFQFLSWLLSVIFAQ